MGENERGGDFELFKELLKLWAGENPIKTNKLQILLLVNGLLLSAVELNGGFVPANWPLCLGGAVLCLVWVLSIGRSSAFQKIWQLKLEGLAQRHSGDERFQIMKVDEEWKQTPWALRATGWCPSKYYLLGAPVLSCAFWLAMFIWFVQ